MDIKQALQSLDPNNADLWTTEGLPLVQAVEALVGKTVTRKEVTEALPGFSRALAIKNAENSDKDNVANTTPVTADQTGTQATPVAQTTEPAKSTVQVQQTEPSEVEDASGDADVDLSLADVLQAKTKAVEEKRLAKNKADKEFAEAQAEYDVALVAFEESKINHNKENPIQAYLQSQVKSAEDRKKRIDIVKDSGINLRELSKTLGGTPLDQSLANKRKG